MPTLSDILQLHGDAYLRRHGSAMPGEHRRVLPFLRDCRSGALGRVSWHCDACSRTHHTPRSCGNRHCPGCQSDKNERWLAEQTARRLEVPYFLLTFTVSEKLRAFMRSHQRVTYRALFRAASGALEKLARDPRHLGAAQLGYTAVLHTWGRQLTYHPHLHVLVPGGGMSADGQCWLKSRPDFLVPVRALSKIFRAKFRDEMSRAGLLAEIDPTVWREAFVTDSRAVGDGEKALGYLARYVFRVAISNSRIVSFDDERVRFRWKKSGSRRWRVMELGVDEFLRRFFQHVLPRGLQKVRHYGFLSPNSRVSLAEVACRVAESGSADETAESVGECEVVDRTRITEPRCSHCGGRLRVIDISFHRVGYRDSG